MTSLVKTAAGSTPPPSEPVPQEKSCTNYKLLAVVCTVLGGILFVAAIAVGVLSILGLLPFVPFALPILIGLGVVAVTVICAGILIFCKKTQTEKLALCLRNLQSWAQRNCANSELNELTEGGKLDKLNKFKKLVERAVQETDFVRALQLTDDGTNNRTILDYIIIEFSQPDEFSDQNELIELMCELLKESTQYDSVGLVEVLAKQDGRGSTLLHHAAYCDKLHNISPSIHLNFAQMKRLMEIRDRDGNTFLHVLTQHWVGIVKILDGFCQPGLPLREICSIRNEKEQTVLHCIVVKAETSNPCSDDFCSVVEELGDEIEPMKLRDKDGNTPLHIVIERFNTYLGAYSTTRLNDHFNAHPDGRSTFVSKANAIAAKLRQLVERPEIQGIINSKNETVGDLMKRTNERLSKITTNAANNGGGNSALTTPLEQP